LDAMPTIDRFPAVIWLRPVATVAAVLGTFIANLTGEFNAPDGVTVADLAHTLFARVLIIPANYVFAIWGLIHLAVMLLGMYQLQPSQHHNQQLARQSYWLIFASLTQCAWIYIFLHHHYALSMAAMLTLLGSLAALYVSLDRSQATPLERWLIHRPISLYLGWISVATIVNAAITLYSVNWTGWGLSPLMWTVIMMFIAALLGLTMILTKSDRTFALVVIWTLAAIGIRHWAIPDLAVPALGLSALLLICTATWPSLERQVFWRTSNPNFMP
jgi:hypothetical protein